LLRQIHLFRFETGTTIATNECGNGDATATGGGVTFTTAAANIDASALHLSVLSHKVANFADGNTHMLHKNFNDGIVRLVLPPSSHS
jgi:hypothetical protein